MKRILSAVLAVLMLLSGTALAQALDYASMTDEELREIINGARLELAKRGLVLQENLLIYESEEIELYLTGEHEFSPDPDFKYLSFGVNALNKSGRMLDLSIMNAVVNGCSVDASGIYDVAANSRKSDEFSFWLDNTDFEHLADFEDVRFEINVYDTESYETVSRSNPIEIHLNVGQMGVSRPEASAPAAEPEASAAAGMQRIESVSGLFSMDVPESYFSVNADLVQLLFSATDEDALQEYFAGTDVDAEEMEDMLKGISAEEFGEFDYVLADDMSGNINVRVTENFGMSPSMFLIMADMLGETVAGQYAEMGIAEENIHQLGVVACGGNSYMGIRVEGVGSQVVSQYMAVNEDKTMILFTFTGIPEETVEEVLGSVILH